MDISSSILLLATGVAIGLLIGLLMNRSFQKKSDEEIGALKERLTDVEEWMEPRLVVADF